MDKKEEELKRLYRLYHERDQEFEKAKGKRCNITILAFSIVFFIVLYKIGNPTGLDILWCLVGSILLAGFYFFFNATIFGQLCQMSAEERAILESIKRRISELE